MAGILFIVAILLALLYIGNRFFPNNPLNNLAKSLFFKQPERYSVGTHVIISGGSKGIGKSLAKKFAELGTHVTIVARNEKDLLAAKAEIEKHRKNTHVQKIRTVSLDLTTITFPCNANSDINEQQRELLDKILGEHERCDILVNCCGSAIPARFDDISQEQFHHMMQVNYFSAVNLTRVLLPIMKARSLANKVTFKATPNGRIVFVSSMCGLMSFFGYSAYSASKFALVGLAEALQMELRPFDIGVTLSFPPDTDTPGFEEENKIKPNVTAEISKVGSIYSPDDVAQAIIRDLRARRFYSTVGLENWLVLMACNSFMPSSLGRVLGECLLAGPLKLLAYFILRSWYKLVDRSASNEIIRAEIALKCSKNQSSNKKSE
uniref:3-dehydrosphinganine reductase n=1 Tax=Aceria tosichella TaxID=561515 RepID=A0A6G1SKZ1_9ACAR